MDQSSSSPATNSDLGGGQGVIGFRGCRIGGWESWIGPGEAFGWAFRGVGVLCLCKIVSIL